MSKVKTVTKNGISLRYVDANNRYEDGSRMRIYLLPGVPMDAGALIPRYDVDEEKIDQVLEMIKKSHHKQAQGIIKMYSGRSMDAAIVLIESEKLNKFDEFAKKLVDFYDKDLMFMHPDIRMSRTDVTAFIMGLYAEVGLAPKEHAEKAKGIVEGYGGPGLVVLLRGNDAE